MVATLAAMDGMMLVGNIQQGRIIRKRGCGWRGRLAWRKGEIKSEVCCQSGHDGRFYKCLQDKSDIKDYSVADRGGLLQEDKEWQRERTRGWERTKKEREPGRV